MMQMKIEIGADVLDSTSNLLSSESVNMTDTWFEMSPNQQHFHDQLSKISENIRNNYHALHSSLWLSKYNLPSKMIDR